jgi:hypothetical protein
MHWFYIVAAFLPLITGYLVIRSMIYYSGKESSARNISPSFFASVALLFALFASLIFGEVWNRVSNINNLMLKQASALRGILRMSETLPKVSQTYRAAIDQYIIKLTDFEGENEFKSMQENYAKDHELFTNNTFHPLYVLATDSSLFAGKPVLQQAIISKTDELRNAWFERKELLKQHILPEKILILFLMGLFTQFSIAFSHLGNNYAIRDSVWLFSLVFFAALSILICIDNIEISKHFISMAALKDVH